MYSQHDMINDLVKIIGSETFSNEDFDAFALKLFRYQYTNNKPFQRYCMQKGKTPRTVKTWKEIPPVPINAFKELPLSSSNPEEAERVFMTSGTTKGIKGKHYHPTVEVFDVSMKTSFKQYFMKEAGRIRMGILFPTEKELPNSSLAHYLAMVLKEFGTDKSVYLIQDQSVAIELLIQELEDAEKTGEPYALLGATFSFVHVFDELEKRNKSFSLPAGSRIFDTGGFKNQSKEMGLDEFYDRLSSTFGVGREECINMYGMTELSTQFYDHGNVEVPSVKSGPHWIRTRVVNPLTGEDVPPGEKGVLVHCDLANFNSVTTILTEDLGVETYNGFLLLGRVQGTEAKGCSLAVEEFIRASKGTR
ncbi:long-chain fatty acid--CoA ligase [Mesobacillus maritimus]|uniref:LuxE/PaaK family acyltransferase n=1 Tax=Mesobacillus maritimus TaxID=1643336 RepID=UPI00384F9F9C